MINNSLYKLKDFLEEKYHKYNTTLFINNDPISIPHKYHLKEDVEIAGFLAAMISWGNRKAIINSANKLMLLMGNSPFDFVMNCNEKQLEKLNNFVYRTFNGEDCKFFVKSLRNIYQNYEGLEKVFSSESYFKWDAKIAIIKFRKIFFSINYNAHSLKHISNPEKGSACKRINMFLRWMVRKDDKGVDLGLWHNIPVSKLICPLDIHSARISRKLNLLKRKSNDWQAALELTEKLKQFDPYDPVKYDFALFGLGVFEKY
ncbi:MAG TPA: TIGR02757 family protein [Bacteroidales bacterium]|nr:TIGR02757 family protein [Bacteroidales bacterium]